MKIEIRVSTNCPTSSVKQEGNWLKVRVKAKPIDGKANEEIIKLLAEHFSVPENKVKIIRGVTSSKKTAEISK